MKLQLLTTVLGCALVAPGLAHKTSPNRSSLSTPNQASSRGARCMTCPGGSRLGVAKSQYADSPEVSPLILTTPSVWPLIFRATGTQIDQTYVFINSVLANPDELCGARGFLNGGCDVVFTGDSQDVQELCHYIRLDCQPSECDATSYSTLNDNNADGKYTRVNLLGITNVLPQCAPCSPPEMWMRKCSSVTLCKYIVCPPCTAQMYMYFEDLPLSTPHNDFEYMGFAIKGTIVKKAEVDPSHVANTYHSFGYGVISWPNAIVHQLGDGSFTLSRCRAFNLNFMFLTFVVTIGEGQPTPPPISVTVKGYKKGGNHTTDYDIAIVSLVHLQPYCFAPCTGFDNLEMLECIGQETDPNHFLTIDNISLCA